MQQARKLRAEQTAEVVRNHEGGTGSMRQAARRPKADGNISREWTLGGMPTEGGYGRNPGEEDRSRTGPLDAKRISEGDAKATRAEPGNGLRRRRKASEVASVTKKTMEDAGKANDPLRMPTSVTPPSKEGKTPRTLNAPPTPREVVG
jgi:hypothetical protein